MEALSKGKSKAFRGWGAMSLSRAVLLRSEPISPRRCPGQHSQTLVAVAGVAVGATLASCEAQGARPGQGPQRGPGHKESLPL